jgi:hypothetical protein
MITIHDAMAIVDEINKKMHYSETINSLYSVSAVYKGDTFHIDFLGEILWNGLFENNGATKYKVYKKVRNAVWGALDDLELHRKGLLKEI